NFARLYNVPGNKAPASRRLEHSHELLPSEPIGMESGRRKFLGLGFAAAGAGMTSPAIADPAPDVEWRLTSSFVSSLDLIYGGAETLSKAVLDLTDGHFVIKVAPAG